MNAERTERSPTILIVDDESVIVELLAAMLAQAGLHVIKAFGSPEALKICTEHDGPIDLLLTDLVLTPPGFQSASSNDLFPYVHGHELARLALIVRKGLRVAFMSGNPDAVLTNLGINRGTLPFLMKPFGLAELISFVHEVLASPVAAEH